MMKRKIVKGLFAAAIAFFATSATAAGKVEVIGDTSHGEVTSKVEGAVVTLTVTPYEGYYIRKSDITVTKTYMPGASSAPRRSVPISDALTLVGADPDDLSQARDYTVTMPGEEYNLLVELNYSGQQVIKDQMVTLSEKVFVYNGQVQRPTVSVTGLTEGKDYKVTYSNPSSSEPGTYTVMVEGYSTWHETVQRTYKIFIGGKAEVNTSITGGTIATAVDGQTVTLTVTPANGYYIRKQDVAVAKTFMPVAAPRRSIPLADQLPLEGDDPDDLSLPRTYTAQLPGWEYSAYVDATFQVRQTITDGMVKLSASSFVYNGSDQKPTVTVTGLTEGKDYILTYDGNSWADVGTYTLKVTGRSTWQGTINKSYTITKAASVVTLAPAALSLIYTGAEQQLVKPGDATGGTLLYSRDGTTFKTAIPKETNAGPYTVYYKVQGDANHLDTDVNNVSVTIGKKAIVISGITAKDKVYDGMTIAMLNFNTVVFGGIVSGDALTVTAIGTFVDANVGTDKVVNISELSLGGTSVSNYELASKDQQESTLASITPRSIENAIIADVPNKTYSGQEQKPGITVTLEDVTLESGTDFTVDYADNINVGTANVTVTGIGNYEGSKQKTFGIDKKELVVKADNKSIYHGADLPELTFEYDGFVNGENEDVLITKPVISTNAVGESAPGEYDIIVEGGEAMNYMFSYINAVLTIKVNDLALDETAVNDDVLKTYDNRYCNVTLQRTLQEGGYNTFTIPFPVGMTQLKEVLGEDVKVKELKDVSLSDGKLTITFDNATDIEAGHPYLIKVSETVVNPVFEEVIVSNTLKPTETVLADFVPTIGATTITGDNVRRVLLVGAGNKLYNPTTLPANIKGFRGYFLLKYGLADQVSSYSMAIDDPDVTDLEVVIDFKGHDMDGVPVYNLNGQQISAPRKGLNIIGRKKIVIK